MSLSLNETQFALFIQHLKNSETEPLCIKKAALVIGLQECGNVRVFGSDIQVRVSSNSYWYIVLSTTGGGGFTLINHSKRLL